MFDSRPTHRNEKKVFPSSAMDVSVRIIAGPRSSRFEREIARILASRDALLRLTPDVSRTRSHFAKECEWPQ